MFSFEEESKGQDVSRCSGASCSRLLFEMLRVFQEQEEVGTLTSFAMVVAWGELSAQTAPAEILGGLALMSPPLVSAPFVVVDATVLPSHTMRPPPNVSTTKWTFNVCHLVRASRAVKDQTFNSRSTPFWRMVQPQADHQVASLLSDKIQPDSMKSRVCCGICGLSTRFCRELSGVVLAVRKNQGCALGLIADLTSPQSKHARPYFIQQANVANRQRRTQLFFVDSSVGKMSKGSTVTPDIISSLAVSPLFMLSFHQTMSSPGAPSEFVPRLTTRGPPSRWTPCCALSTLGPLSDQRAMADIEC